MSSSGQQILANRVPGERIATLSETTPSAGFTTTEVVVHTLVAPLVIGRRYGVWFCGDFLSTTAGDNLDVKIREDSASGTAMQRQRLDMPETTVPERVTIYAEHVAAATGNKTFVVTGDRVAGAGTITTNPAVGLPNLFWVEYIDG